MFSFKNIIRLIGVLIALSMSSSALAQSNCEINFIMLGDSITQGLMRDANGVLSGVITEPNGADLDQGSYGPSLRGQTQALGCDSVRAFNWGVGGFTASQGIGLADQAIASLSQVTSEESLNIALIMFGANDAFSRTPRSSFINSISLIQSRISAAGILPVLATITENQTPFPELNDRVNEFNSDIIAFAQQQSLILVDQNSAVTPFSVLNSGDRLHISAAGYEVMATAWFNGVESVLVEYIESLRTTDFLPAVYLLLLEDE